MIARMMDNITLGFGNPDPPDVDIDTVVRGLRHSRNVSHNVRYRGPVRPPPSREEIVATVGEFARALFPAHYGRPELLDRGELTPDGIDQYVGLVLRRALASLNDQVRRTLPFTSESVLPDEELHRRALAIVREFAAGLPAIRGLLVSDLRAAYAGDPAATGYPEILLVYPGMMAVIHYRLAHALHGLGARFLARHISEIAHSLTGIDIHPGAQIGGSFFIDHGTGVVIGETTRIGDRVRIYQGVTLGALTVPHGEARPEPGKRRHPTLEDDVVIYANATILGGETVIGQGSVVGGNAFVTTSVPPGSKVPGSSRTQRG